MQHCLNRQATGWCGISGAWESDCLLLITLYSQPTSGFQFLRKEWVWTDVPEMAFGNNWRSRPLWFCWNCLTYPLVGAQSWSRSFGDDKWGQETENIYLEMYLVNRTIRLWNQLPAEALVTLSYRLRIFRKSVRKVIISEVKWRDVKRGDETSKSCGKWKMGSEVKWSEVKICGGMCVLSLICSYAICVWVPVQSIVWLLFVLCLLLFVVF